MNQLYWSQKLAKLTELSTEPLLIKTDKLKTPKAISETQKSRFHLRALTINYTSKSIQTSPTQSNYTDLQKHKRQCSIHKHITLNKLDQSESLLAAQLQQICHKKVKSQFQYKEQVNDSILSKVNFSVDMQKSFKQNVKTRIKFKTYQGQKNEINLLQDLSQFLKPKSQQHAVQSTHSPRNENQFKGFLVKTYNTFIPIVSPNEKQKQKLQKGGEIFNKDDITGNKTWYTGFKSTNNNTASLVEKQKLFSEKFYCNQNKVLFGEVKQWIKVDKRQNKRLEVFHGLRTFSHSPTQLNCNPYSFKQLI